MIKIEGLSKIYATKGQSYQALMDVDLSIEKGEMTAIMGPSGSGKTTLLNIIGGMDRQTSGKYYFNELEVSALSNAGLEKFRKENVGFIFQHFELIEYLTVYENVEIPLLARRISKKKRKELITDALERLGIGELANKTPDTLSGGQQQRAAIARTMVTDSCMLLADEPTGALDSARASEIMEIFENLRKSGKTIIIVTHDSNVAKHCDRIIEIIDGKVVNARESL